MERGNAKGNIFIKLELSQFSVIKLQAILCCVPVYDLAFFDL